MSGSLAKLASHTASSVGAGAPGDRPICQPLGAGGKATRLHDTNSFTCVNVEDSAELVNQMACMCIEVLAGQVSEGQGPVSRGGFGPVMGDPQGSRAHPAKQCPNFIP